jgi:hypothetical protein
MFKPIPRDMIFTTVNCLLTDPRRLIATVFKNKKINAQINISRTMMEGVYCTPKQIGIILGAKMVMAADNGITTIKVYLKHLLKANLRDL